MNGEELKLARLQKGWTQQRAAKSLGVTQAYLSMLEQGRRTLPYRFARRAAGELDAPATALPLCAETVLRTTGSEGLRTELASLGYPGFAHLRKKARHNPAEVLDSALNESDLDTRVVEGLPWLVLRYADMDWEWLVRNAKLFDRQNRLGFVVTLASQLAVKNAEPERLRKLNEYVAVLDRSRLVKEDTLCRDSMTQVEREWLRRNRPPEAAHWNLLTDLKAEHLQYVEL